MDWDLILPALGALLIKLPLYLTWLVGIALIVVYSKRHAKNTRFFLFVVVGLFIVDICVMIFNSSFYIYTFQSDMDTQLIKYIIGGVNFILSLVESILWGLLIYLFLAKTRPKTKNEN